MKIALAQIASVPADLETNSRRHAVCAQRAAELGADLVAFPELSLSSYHPALVTECALTAQANEWQSLQACCERFDIAMLVGAPLRCETGVAIGMFYLRPQQALSVYTKQTLHADETPYFVAQPSDFIVTGDSPRIGLAICYEMSIDCHAERSAEEGAEIYLASVAKLERHMSATKECLKHLSLGYGFNCLMVNAVGPADGEECAGQSTVVARDGTVLHALQAQEALLIYDCDSQAIAVETLGNLS